MAEIKKFLDSDGLTYFCKKFQDYPSNEILGAVINAIDNTKVDKIEGKNLSTNDYTNEDKNKLNSSITFNKQNLSNEQQAQARINIGAADKQDVEQLISDVHALDRDVNGYVDGTPVKHFRISFNRVWNTNTNMLHPSAAVAELRFYDANGVELPIESVTADSEYSAAYSATKVLDGDLATFWSSKDAEGVVHTLECVLTEAGVAARIGIAPRKDVDVGRLDELTVEASADGAVWTQVLHIENEKDGWESMTWRYFNLIPTQVIGLPMQTQIDACRADAVLHTMQSLTEDQQTQARENIGAADVVAVNELKDEVMAYDRAEPAKYYRIVFHNMWNKSTSSLFTTTAAIGEVAFYDADGEEVAIASAVADSELNTSRTAKHAYDRNVDTYWESASDETTEHMLTFTLAQAAVIVRLSMMPQKYFLYCQPNEFTVYVSQDGETWQLSSTFTDQRNGWNYAIWRNYDIRPYTVTIPSLRTEFNSMRDNYASVKGTALALESAAKSRIKHLVVTPNSPMPNDATPDNVLDHGLHSGIVVTPTEGEPVSFAPELRLTCLPAPWSYLADATIGGVACSADICDWSARKLRRRFASYAFKGREDFKTYGSNAGCFSNFRFTLPTTPTLTGNNNNVIGLCTHYPYVPYVDICNQTSGYGISITANPNGTHMLVVFDERFTTVDELMAYFAAQNDAGTPVTFYYMLNPAVEEEIGAEDFERFEGFLLPGGESTVKNPDGCTLEMDYWKEFPTKNYGDWIYDLLSLKEMRAAAGSGGGISLPNTVTVEEFGAVGDGLTDDTQAFVDALATGKNVLCLGGGYVLSDRLNIMVAGQKLTGSGHTSLKFISTDPEKVGIDMRNSYSMLSGVALYGTGIGFGLRLGRTNPDVGDSHNKNRIDDVRIYDFEVGITTTSKLNQSIFSRIVIYRCENALYFPDVTQGTGSYITGIVDVIFDSVLIDLCKVPYLFEASNVCFNALNIGLIAESKCYTYYGNYVFINSKYESSPDSAVDQVVHLGNAAHVYIGHHFSFTTSTPETTCGFRANKGNGLVFIGCDYQTNGFPEPIVPVKHFIAPDSTFNTPRAVWFGPGELTNATRLPRPILDDYPENRKYYVDFYDEVSVPAFDAETDEGKVLKIVDGVAQWVTP